MEIDAIVQQRASLIEALRSICRAQKLCFRFLKPIVAGTHTGSINCLNAPVTLDQRKSFVDRARQAPNAQIASIQTAQPVPVAEAPLTDHQDSLATPPSPPAFPSPFEPEDLHGHNELYEDYEEAKVAT
jgi:hypothetical protein